MSSMDKRSSIRSSPRMRTLQPSFFRMTPSERLSTMPVRHFGLAPKTPEERQALPSASAELSTTCSPAKPFGRMSTVVRASHIRRSWTGPSMLQCSVDQVLSQRRYTLARVTVCICIGRWMKHWTLRRGEDMRPGSLNFLITTGFTSTRLALRIYRRYSELPAPTTARAD